MDTEEKELCTIDSDLLSSHNEYKFPKSFNCGDEKVNAYFSGNLKRSLKSGNIKAIGAISPGNEVIGFIALTVGDADRNLIRRTFQIPNLPPRIPVVKVAMIGVDARYQKQGIGQELLMMALYQAIRVHTEVPIKGVYLDSAPDAIEFYERHDFQRLGDAEEHGGTPMFLEIDIIIEALKASVGEAE